MEELITGNKNRKMGGGGYKRLFTVFIHLPSRIERKLF